MKKTTRAARFTKKIDSEVLEFSESLTVDIVLFEADLKVTMAHVQMLAKCKLITKKELETIVSGLKKIKEAVDKDKFPWSYELEDVHMNIESQLTKIVGDVGKKIHMGRSRNDLVTTDLRIYLRDFIDVFLIKLRDLQYALSKMAIIYSDSLFPGYTHLQVAQPVTFGHHLLAWNEMMHRDEKRLLDVRKHLNTMPLGSAALSGTSYKIDRKMVAKKLGFDEITSNSMDAVSDRDYVCDFAYANSMTMLHLSRMAEELVLWTNPQFNLISLDESFCTGSSIMPQKKNPDTPELIRGKTAGVFGNLISLLSLMKGLPLTYNRDLQEDKKIIFDSIDVVLSCLNIMPRLILTISLNEKRAEEISSSSFSTATDLADYLSLKGIPFRTAHDIVGKIVKHCEKKNLKLDELPLEQLQKFSPLIKSDVYKYLDPKNTIRSRTGVGETSPKSVTSQAHKNLKRLKALGYKE